MIFEIGTDRDGDRRWGIVQRFNERFIFFFIRQLNAIHT